ncbi:MULTISPECIES: DUF3796 domain-containing protein [Paraclostridium]|uniref:DUF3796 domain-containing protein n=1 Tax=Paraclostridium TaxID=1849822 RepID=UPI001472CACD|nr:MULTISPECIES: DUF3796 domain-containing protein [Paraclostridium]MCU9811081.1 DUF3796 domain-containing protein [Paraclostridium sp. AKS81]
MKKLNKYSVLFAFFGLLGIKHIDSDPLGLLWFMFFAQLSHIWWSKLGDCEDERLIANKHRAGTIALYTGFVIAIVSSYAIRLYTSDLLSLYKLQILILSLTFAISVNLWGFLTYKFDTGN